MKSCFLLLSSFCFVVAMRANTIVFNTLGPGATYVNDIAWPVGPSALGPATETAARFTAGASGILANIDLGLTVGRASGGPVDVSVFLYGDANQLPDNSNQTFLGSANPTRLFGSSIPDFPLVSVHVSGDISVTAGSTYWLVLKPAGSGAQATWNESPSTHGRVAFSTDDSTWSHTFEHLPPLPAFRITVASAVPDSGGTVLLLLFSIATLVWFAALDRKRFATWVVSSRAGGHPYTGVE